MRTTPLHEPAVMCLLSDEQLNSRYDQLQRRCSRHEAESAEFHRCIEAVIRRTMTEAEWAAGPEAMIAKGRP